MSDTMVKTALIGFDYGPYYPETLGRLQQRCYDPETLPPWLFQHIGGEDITEETPFTTTDGYAWYRAIQFCPGNNAYVVLVPRMTTKHRRGVGPDRHIAIFSRTPMDEREQRAAGFAVSEAVITACEEFRTGNSLVEGHRQKEEKLLSNALLLCGAVAVVAALAAAYLGYASLRLLFTRFIAPTFAPYDPGSILLILGLTCLALIAFYHAIRDPERP